MNSDSRYIQNKNGKDSSNFRKSNEMNYSNATSNAGKELIDFKKLFSLLQRHIWIILFSVIMFISGSYYLVNHYLLPIYQSQGTMLISNNESALPGSGGADGGNGGGVSSIISRSFTLNSGNTVQSAIYLFQSRELSEEVARRLLNQGTSSNNSAYPSTWLSYPEDSTTVTIDQAASRIRRGLSVEPVERGSNLLRVSYASYTPEEAAQVVNLALEVFQEKSLEQKRNTADKALSFLESKKEEIRAELNNAEDRLVKFKNENQLVAIDAQAGNSVTNLSQLRAEKQNLEIQLESINSSIENYEEQMESIKPGMADQYSKAVGPTIANYQERLAELRTRRFVLLSNNPQLKSNPNSEPELKKLNQQIGELEDEIQSLSEGLVKEGGGLSVTGDGNLAQELNNIQRNLIQLRIDKNQIESQIQVLNQRIKDSQQFLDTFPDNQAKLARLETEVQRHKELLNTIISQESEMSLWQQTQNSSGSIVDPAKINYIPVKPNKIIWYSASVILGILLPVMFLIIKSSLSTIIRSSEQLDTFPYPLLSIVYDHSLIKRNGWFSQEDKKPNKSNISKSLVFYHYVDTPVAESYRKIVSQILYSNPDATPGSILITSSGQGEGKTTLGANLGASFAEIDKKTLIIDCDFRRPAMHKLFSLENSLGINEVLFEGKKLSDAIKETGVTDLYLLPTGTKPVSPAQLLASEKFREMIKVIRPNYDMIIFDTPPHGLVSDVKSLLNFADLTIVAAKFGETKENILKLTLKELDDNKQSNINLVLTGYIPSKSYDTYDTKELHEYKYKEYYEYEKVEK